MLLKKGFRIINDTIYTYLSRKKLDLSTCYNKMIVDRYILIKQRTITLDLLLSLSTLGDV